MNKLIITFLLALLQICIVAQDIKVLESNDSYIKFSINLNSGYQIKDTTVNEIRFQYIKTKQAVLRKNGEPALPFYTVNLGIPHDSKISFQIIEDKVEKYSNKFILPLLENDPGKSNENELTFNKKIYSENNILPGKIN